MVSKASVRQLPLRRKEERGGVCGEKWGWGATRVRNSERRDSDTSSSSICGAAVRLDPMLAQQIRGSLFCSAAQGLERRTELTVVLQDFDFNLASSWGWH